MKARIHGAEIEYEVRGGGLPLLLLHAFPLGLSMWDAQAASLAGRALVVRFDCRGFGGSPAGDGQLSMERIADDAVGLLDHLGLARAVVCGLSMGGYAAFALVRRHADRLRGLVLCDTRAAADTEEGRKSRALLAEQVLREGPGAAADAFVPRLLGPTTQRERPELVARVREMALRASARGVADALAGLASRADSTPTLREVRVPTLVIVGAEDALTPPADAQFIADGISGSRLAVIPGAGHLANLENPAVFDAALGEFLGSLRG
jgi:3-oxoadipate enol-lactonase